VEIIRSEYEIQLFGVAQRKMGNNSGRT